MIRKILAHIAALICTAALMVHAADNITTPSIALTPAATADSSASKKDSVQVQPLSLLPEKLGPMESLLWSEHGFLRNHFDFPLTAAGREKEMHLRRTMLTVHEIGGFTTLAAMLATVVVGQMIYNDYPNRTSNNMRDLKSTLASATILLYFTTASLSIFTPPPVVRHKEWSTISTHKLLGTVHFTGMLLTPLLASYIGGEERPGSSISRNAETLHMVSGYITTAAFATAMLVVTF